MENSNSRSPQATPEFTPHRDAQAFPKLLQATCDAAVAFLNNLPERPPGTIPNTTPVTRSERPPSDTTESADRLPEHGLGAMTALTRFRDRFEGGLSGSAGPRYLGFVTGGTTPAALAGDWLASTYDQNLMKDGDSLASAVERETLIMLRHLFGLSARFEGAFVSGATMANATALATARQWAGQRLGVDTAEEGLGGLPRIPVLCGAPHASIAKATSMLGMGRRSVESLELIPGRQCMDPAALETRLAQLDGTPAIVVASAGDVNTGDFDDLTALAELCQHHDAWLHIDGAFGLFAACDPDKRPLLAGYEHADSIATDGHKWLNVPYDSGIVFTRHLHRQERVFRAAAAYLGEGRDLLHRTPENSRRFRALPAWMTLLAYGRSGYRDLVRRSCALARALGNFVERSEHFDLLASVRLNVVCFAPHRDEPGLRDRFLDRLTRDGRVFMSPTHFADRDAIRAAFANWSTSQSDLDLTIEALRDTASRV